MMQHLKVRIASSLMIGLSLALAGGAQAQDVQYDPPDVLLLIDTSGSMQETAFRESGRWALPKCSTDIANPKPVQMSATALEDAGHTYTAPDRWMTVLDTLTGTFSNMRCVAQSRTDAAFRQEYALGASPATGYPPIDAGYYLPYNRIVSVQGGKACTPSPSWNATVRSALNTNGLAWPTMNDGPIVWRTATNFDPNNINTTDCKNLAFQDSDGLISQYADRVRFALMTFDTMPNWMDAQRALHTSTGLIAGSATPDFEHGILDTWSYFPNWFDANATGVPARGNPGGCSVLNNLLEVGARGPGAPPWEGRLISFGSPTAKQPSDLSAHNEQVRLALLAARPYGATPIAGMLADAKNFILSDNFQQAQDYYGGKADSNFTTQPGQGCAKRVAILVTDGLPNLDLRPECAGTGGNCPYDVPETTAEALKNNNVPLYVIGLNISSGNQKCSDLVKVATACNALTACDSSCPIKQCAYGYCIPDADTEALAACCTIKRIANKGRTDATGLPGDPYFVEDKGALRAAFSSILGSLIPASSRTVPVFVPGNVQYNASNQSAIASAQFFTPFSTRTGDLDTGKLRRKRWTCEMSAGKVTPVEKTFDATAGDEFQTNVNGQSNTNRDKRTVYTVVAEIDTNKILSDRTIRPWYKPAANGMDGLDCWDNSGIKCRATPYGVLASGTGFDPNTKMVTGTTKSIIGNVDSRALLGSSVTCGANGCCFPTPSQLVPTADQCRDRFLELEFGFTVSGNADITYQRYSAFGSVVHSTPVAVGVPQEYLRDDSYLKFQRDFAARTPVLYAASTDGQLHAFQITKTDQTLNELWTFLPPAVLVGLRQQFVDRYHAAPTALLDGPVIVRDVTGRDPSAADAEGNCNGACFLTRSKGNVKSTTDIRWYTILVGSFGASGGYYAMDVTWPDPNSTASPPTGYQKGPRFLWQITTDYDGNPVFGKQSATPSIATMYFKSPGATAAAEHVVAILPGGAGGVVGNAASSITYDRDMVDPKVTARTQTQTYTNDAQNTLPGARSITIVRLDTGEVVRTLRYGVQGNAPNKNNNQAPVGLYLAGGTGRITNAGFDAPIVGRVVTYPSDVGTVADRAFVGDAEGHLWRVDLSSPDPTVWSADMFFDAYPTLGYQIETAGYSWSSGQPIQTPPILSVDQLGRVTVAFSTGEQNSLIGTAKSTVWSLTEVITPPSTIQSQVNWYFNAANAKNPPGSPTGADVRFQAGERVTGQMSLFASVLYFTSYDPATADKQMCTAGNSYLWGVDYLNPGTVPNVKGSPQDGPQPRFNPSATGTGTDVCSTGNCVRYVALGAGAIPFGAGILQVPSCYSTDTSITNDFLGYGSHTSIASSSPATFKLVVQGGPLTTTGEPPTKSYNLIPPVAPAQIDSWASIVE